MEKKALVAPDYSCRLSKQDANPREQDAKALLFTVPVDNLVDSIARTRPKAVKHDNSVRLVRF